MPDLDQLRENANPRAEEALALLDRAARDLPSVRELFSNPTPVFENRRERFDLLTRMLLSCLVDADRLDTSGQTAVQAPLRAPERLAALMRHIEKLPNGSDSPVNTARRQVLQNCLAAAASDDHSLFSLSVPTGGGKTLSSMAFALKRAMLRPEQYRRIIVVIPYLSIIEQNAEIYAEVFGRDAILEHHSGSFTRLQLREDHLVPHTDQQESYSAPSLAAETENWDAPIIVTTSVRFFESIFSNHPSDLRRIHNIARSIVILDEVQVLPQPLLAPLLAVMNELCTDWGCTFILGTATKPAFEKTPNASASDPRWPKGSVKEIVTDPVQLHRSLRRVSIDWRLQSPVDWPEVAGWMLQHDQALCVVNIRDHAAQLFDELANRCDKTAVFHLSTRMCAQHRLQVIERIRRQLSAGSRCLVVSTQLIEAGVDVDFPVAFRALGPLSSIVQTAGRADREGRLTAAKGSPAGMLIVFKPVDHRMPPNEYETATGITETLAKAGDIQPDDLEKMNAFFEDCYRFSNLGADLLDLRRNAKFKSLAEQFEMISSRTRDVFVPFQDGALLIAELRSTRQLTGELRRALQRYTVGLQPFELAKARGSVMARLDEQNEIWIASGAAYDNDKGLVTEIRAEALVL